MQPNNSTLYRNKETVLHNEKVAHSDFSLGHLCET
jgi:hypothetical protein